LDSRAWLAHLETFGIKLGLATIDALAGALQQPHLAFPVLHVAGTNGKGSVSAMVAHALSAAGLRTGRYTSPHLVRLEERFAIDGRTVGGAQLDAALAEVRAAVARLTADGRLTIEPTYFEATTAAAFVLFRQAHVDVAVVEVGLGGRYDATNIVEPLATCIVSIAADHEAQLGTSISGIAEEKAGIIKPGVPVVAGPLPAAAREVVGRVAAGRAAPVVDAFAETRVTATAHADTFEVVIETDRARYGPMRLALAGRHQVDNAVVAVRLLETAATRGLPVSTAAIVSGLTAVRWPARLQTVETPRGMVTIDGAHNPAGAAALASYLRARHPDGLPLVIGMMADKDAASMLAALAPVARPLILTRAPGARAAEPEMLARQADALDAEMRVLIERDVAAALERAWAFGPAIGVAGSLYLAGAVLSLLGVGTD
jgi:dihydrofolate synthase / folylpolyglutamate synthase